MFKYFAKSSKSFTNLQIDSIFLKHQFKTFTSSTQNKTSAQEYEREWTKLYEAKMKEKMDSINKELSVSDKTEVEFIFDHIKTLSKDEMKYLAILLKVKETKLNGVSPLEYNSLQPSNLTQMDNLWPKENPNWFNTTNLQATVNSFQGAKGSVVAATTGAEAAKATEGAKESKPKDDKPVEKAAYDVKLVSFDSSKKIALIKEVRGWLNLGLKEAKELVEKAPTDLKKAVKKEEADEIKKKLADIGAVVDLL